MPISVTCSDCDKKLKVKDEAAGKKVRCPGCSNVISVPRAPEPEIEVLDEFDDFEDRKPSKKSKRSSDDDLDFDDGEMDDLGDELPVRGKSSGKGSKKTKVKAKSKRTSSGSFFDELYDGQLSDILRKVFWVIFGVMLLVSIFGPMFWVAYVMTMLTIVSIRGIITLCWWSKLAAENSSLGAVMYIAFFLFPFLGLLWGALNNEIAKKPNTIFMYSIGILAMTFTVGFGSIVLSTLLGFAKV